MFSVFTALLGAEIAIAPVSAPTSNPSSDAPFPSNTAATVFGPADETPELEIPSDWESKGVKSGVCVVA
jgi:hypothetical protein